MIQASHKMEISTKIIVFFFEISIFFVSLSFVFCQLPDFILFRLIQQPLAEIRMSNLYQLLNAVFYV